VTGEEGEFDNREEESYFPPELELQQQDTNRTRPTPLWTNQLPNDNTQNHLYFFRPIPVVLHLYEISTKGELPFHYIPIIQRDTTHLKKT